MSRPPKPVRYWSIPMGTGLRGVPGRSSSGSRPRGAQCTDRVLDGLSLQFRWNFEYLDQFFEHLVGSLEDVVPGEGQERVSAPSRRPLALEVGLPGLAGAVVAEALQLDGDGRVTVAGVEVVSALLAVEARERQAGGLQTALELPFHLAEEQGVVAVVDGAELGGAFDAL